MSDVLVVGYGPAAHRFVAALRRRGHDGTVTVLGAEPGPAYNRALLTTFRDSIALPEPPPGVEVRTGVTASRIDRDKRVVYAAGRPYPYRVLVLATGARPRIPALPGLLDAAGRLVPGVTALRTLADRDRVRGRVTVLGGGVLGVEAALGLRRCGGEVALVHPNPHPMERHLDPTAGDLLAAHLDERGVALRLGRRAVAYKPGGLVLDGGEVLPADTLLLCTGAVPEVELARRAGLPVRTGIVVDGRLRTADPHVYAIGDCAELGGAVSGHVAAAWEQAETLAAVLTGAPARHRPTATVVRLKAPGFDAVALGAPEAVRRPGPGVETVTLSDPARRRYARLALTDGRIAGAVLVGLPRAIATATQLHDRAAAVPPGRLDLLLGMPPRRPGPVELPDDAVVCLCYNVPKGALATAWRGGARDLPRLAEATRATTGCGGCADDVRRVCASLERAA